VVTRRNVKVGRRSAGTKQRVATSKKKDLRGPGKRGGKQRRGKQKPTRTEPAKGGADKINGGRNWGNKKKGLLGNPQKIRKKGDLLPLEDQRTTGCLAAQKKADKWGTVGEHSSRGSRGKGEEKNH